MSKEKSLGIAYATSSLTLSFITITFGGIISVFIDSAAFFDTYVMFSDSYSVLYMYFFYSIMQFIYFGQVADLEETMEFFLKIKFIKENSGIIYMSSLLVSGLFMLIVVVNIE